MAEQEVKIVRLEEKMSVANNRIKGLEAHKDTLTEAIGELEKSILTLSTTVETLGNKEAARAKWINFILTSSGAVLITSIVNFVLRGGFVP